MSYKKRAQAGWETDKEISNSSERVHAKKEVAKELLEIEQGEEFREKKGSKKKLSKLEKQERRVMRAAARAEKWKNSTFAYLFKNWYNEEKRKLEKLNE